MITTAFVATLMAAAASAAATTTATAAATTTTTPTASGNATAPAVPGVKASYVMLLKKYKGAGCANATWTTEVFPMESCQTFFNVSANAADSWYTTHNGTHFTHTRSFGTGKEPTCKGVANTFKSTIKMGECSTLEENVGGVLTVRSEKYVLENWGFDTSRNTTATGELQTVVFNTLNTTTCPDLRKQKVTGNSNIDPAGKCTLYYSIHEDVYANGTTQRYTSSLEDMQNFAKKEGRSFTPVYTRVYPAGADRFLRLVFTDANCTTVAGPITVDYTGPTCAVDGAKDKAQQVVFTGTVNGSVASTNEGPIPTPAPVEPIPTPSAASAQRPVAAVLLAVVAAVAAGAI